MALLKGLIPILITPMTADHDVDAEASRKLVEFLCRKNIGGLWALGHEGEAFSLTFEQKVVFAQGIAEQLGGRVPLIVGSSFRTADDHLCFFEAMEGYPVHGFHIMGQDSYLGDTQMEQYATFLADNAPEPIWLYNCARRGKSFRGNILKKLSQHANIAGMHVNSADIGELSEAVILRSEAFDVIGSHNDSLFAMLCMGAEAQASSAGGCMPELFYPVFKAFEEDDIEKARRIQLDVSAFLQSLPKTDNGGTAAEEKFVLHQRNVCEEHVNQFYRGLNSHEKKRVLGELTKISFSLQNGNWRHWTGRSLENVA